MDYNPPFGSADPNASYADRNTPGAIAGSRVPAAAVEHPQREIMAVIAGAGLTGSSADLTQLLQAILELISQATGGGDVSNFVTFAAARARMPVFPEVLTLDGSIPVVSPSTGQVRVPAGYDFIHRGIFNITTVQTDFVTVANKTYHLRWSPTGGFELKDLADIGYNPTSVAETNSRFDTVYDDMLVARVVTSAGNVPTVTNLANRDRLRTQITASLTYPSTPANQSTASFSSPVNWARTPTPIVNWAIKSINQPGNGTGDVDESFAITPTRYAVSGSVMLDYAGGGPTTLSVTAFA